MDSLLQVFNGEADLGISTPAGLLKAIALGVEIFQTIGPMPSLRALAVLPQRDRLMFATASGLNVSSFSEIRDGRIPLNIAVSTDDGTNLIGYVSARTLEAHGLDEETMQSWGGSWVRACRPEQVIELVKTGRANAVIQEAIMTPWWRELIEGCVLSPVSMEKSALNKLSGRDGFEQAFVTAGFWSNVMHDIRCVDFSDFVIVVRADMPDDVAHLLTWCLVETRHVLEAQYRHIPPERSPLSYPLEPKKMCQSPIPLHRAAEQFYRHSGVLSDGTGISAQLAAHSIDK
jgi:TRAP-type uncharacterized transport system substrate-binding protein